MVFSDASPIDLCEHGCPGQSGPQSLNRRLFVTLAILDCSEPGTATHGLGRHDNDFVLGLLGSELLPLSHVVQTMRKTQQTAEYVEQLGPFFVGRTICHVPASP